MDLLKILFVINVMIGVSVTQEWLYTPPFPSEAIEAANSILTRRERPIDNNMSPNKFNLTEGNLNGSLITPPDVEDEERKETLMEEEEENITTILNDLPTLEEFPDITDTILKRIGKPYNNKEYETNVVQEDDDSFLESLGRAIGGGGVPGADFPILYDVPKTGFSCGDGSLVGYYADTDPKAACQVFHICQEDGRHDSFLCPIGTLFNQKYFVCDWWYNVDCNKSAEFYSLNEFLLRESWKGGLRPINFNLKNRTESFEQIIAEMKNIKENTKLFANKHNIGDSLISNLSSAVGVDTKFEESDIGNFQSPEIEGENFGMLSMAEVEKRAKEERIIKGSEVEKIQQKTDKVGKKEEVKKKPTKEEKVDSADNERRVEEGGEEEGKSESATETIEGEQISNIVTSIQSDKERTEEDISNTKDSVEKESTIPEERITSIKQTENKADDINKESIAANKVSPINLQIDENQTSKPEESDETPTKNKETEANVIQEIGSPSADSKSKVPYEEEIKGYSYSSRDGTEIEEILSKKNPNLNSYGVVTDNLVNKKGIRN